MSHKSIRQYTPEAVDDSIIETIVRAGQQAAFASQAYSLLLKRDSENNPFHAPLLFTVCIDAHKFELIMKKRGWNKTAMNDVFLFILNMQDACYAAQNLVIAAESMGLGTCYLGMTPYIAESIAKEYNLPERVFPFVQITVGYPDEEPDIRPRYPLDFTLFEDKYGFSEDTLKRAMDQMDLGYLKQDYYRKANYMIPLNDRNEKYDFSNYSWTEHISRKWGQWYPKKDSILKILSKCGFDIADKSDQS
ncbi:MAG: nitroreductase family protein [bacterium]